MTPVFVKKCNIRLMIFNDQPSLGLLLSQAKLVLKIMNYLSYFAEVLYPIDSMAGAPI